MFEHFTEHARRALDFENMEAQRMHHAYLGTEHLLLGLIREPQGHGHRALENLGLSLKQVRQTVARLVEAGPDTDWPRGVCPTVHFRHVMEMAVEEARQLRHGHVGTEHLLLALLREPDGVAVRALAELGCEPQALRGEVLAMLAAEAHTASGQ